MWALEWFPSNRHNRGEYLCLLALIMVILFYNRRLFFCLFLPLHAPRRYCSVGNNFSVFVYETYGFKVFICDIFLPFRLMVVFSSTSNILVQFFFFFLLIFTFSFFHFHEDKTV